MQNLISNLSRVNELIGKLSAWFSLTMVLIMFAIVVLRYLFDMGWIAMQESVIYLHAGLFMLGAAYTLQKDEHVRVDIFYRNFSIKKKALINFFGTFAFLFPVCFYILAMSWEYVWDSWQLLESSPEAGGIPAVFLLKTLIPLGAILLIIQGFANALQQLVLLRAPQER